MTDDSYTVGFGRPPRHTRFKPGQSGNPRGRPRATKDVRTLFERHLDKLVTVTRDGRKARISMRELFVMNIVKEAVTGDARSQAILLRHMHESGRPDPFGARPFDEKILLKLAASLISVDKDSGSEE